MQPYREAGKLEVVGVVQEQHPDRARLYQQWRQLDWPIAVDSLNLLDYEVVPVPVLIDEHGIVREAGRVGREQLAAFVEGEFAAPGAVEGWTRAQLVPPQKLGEPPHSLEGAALRLAEGDAWLQFGNEWPSNGELTPLDRAVTAYEAAAQLAPTDARTAFRLGVALRRRADSSLRQRGDSQRAVEMWQRALELRPSQYIWRRRIQQYGPRLTKPYNFYAWVEKARGEITSRGEKPWPLRSEPRGSELLGRAEPDKRALIDPDPQGKVPVDTDGLVRIETLVTPPRVRPGGRVRVSVRLELDPKTKPYWNNEADPLAVVPARTESVRVLEAPVAYPMPKEAETREVRVVEFELGIEGNAKPGIVQHGGYAVYSVCDGPGGVCRYLRQKLELRFEVEADAPEIR